MFCGLAISEDGGRSFNRYSEAPVLDRYDTEVYARCGVGAMKDQGKFKMWYIGSIEDGWIKNDSGKQLPLYAMRYIESEDGVNWHGAGKVCMYPRLNNNEHGFGRPHVWKSNNLYKMIYSIRKLNEGYCLGY
jgi:hypothetical protein